MWTGFFCWTYISKSVKSVKVWYTCRKDRSLLCVQNKCNTWFHFPQISGVASLLSKIIKIYFRIFLFPYILVTNIVNIPNKTNKYYLDNVWPNRLWPNRLWPNSYVDEKNYGRTNIWTKQLESEFCQQSQHQNKVKSIVREARKKTWDFLKWFCHDTSWINLIWYLYKLHLPSSTKCSFMQYLISC